MPSKNFDFITHVDPVSPPKHLNDNGIFTFYSPDYQEILVEAPGTAPGSVTLILQSVYYHSRKTDRSNIVG